MAKMFVWIVSFSVCVYRLRVLRLYWKEKNDTHIILVMMNNTRAHLRNGDGHSTAINYFQKEKI